MSEWSDQQQDPPATGGENPSIDEQVETEGDEGVRSARTTPPIGEDAEPGQTQVPAPADDVGVPSDEEIAREEQQAGGEE